MPCGPAHGTARGGVASAREREEHHARQSNRGKDLPGRPSLAAGHCGSTTPAGEERDALGGAALLGGIVLGHRGGAPSVSSQPARSVDDAASLPSGRARLKISTRRKGSTGFATCT